MPTPVNVLPTSLADAALLEPFFGREAEDVLESCEGSFQRLFHEARNLRTPGGVVLAAALEVVRRALAEELAERCELNGPQVVMDYLRTFFVGRPHEVFVVLYLDAKNRLLRTDEAFNGTLTQCSVYPREIVRRALELGAAGVIFSHNHPSGVAEPSDADKWLTDNLKRALAMVDVRVLDHVVIAAGGAVSFTERGLI